MRLPWSNKARLSKAATHKSTANAVGKLIDLLRTFAILDQPQWLAPCDPSIRSVTRTPSSRGCPLRSSAFHRAGPGEYSASGYVEAVTGCRAGSLWQMGFKLRMQIHDRYRSNDSYQGTTWLENRPGAIWSRSIYYDAEGFWMSCVLLVLSLHSQGQALHSPSQKS